MIEAELHHKYRDIENSEDILTSTTFGLLKYSILKEILKKFLGMAKLYSNEKLFFAEELERNNILSDSYKFRFWKYFDNYGEPDLIIEGNNYVILIEVKYHADLSGEDQLKKYWNLLEKKYDNSKSKYLIFLSTDTGYPNFSEASIGRLKDKNFYLLSWYDLAGLIEDELSNSESFTKEILRDLNLYLKNRGIRIFGGFLKNYNKPDIFKLPIFWQNKALFSSNYNNFINRKTHILERRNLMNEKGKNVMEMMKNMKELYNEIADFLKACDKVAAEFKYAPKGSSAVISDLSVSLDRPDYWLPMWMYRTYSQKENKLTFFSLNIALYNPDKPEIIDEPLIIIAKIEFSREELPSDWEAWNLYFSSEPYSKTPKQIYKIKDLQLNTEELKRDEKKIKSIKDITLFSTPLLEIQNINSIKDMIFNKIADK